MHVMGRIGFMGLGIALVGCLRSERQSSQRIKPIDHYDGGTGSRRLPITSPKDGGKVSVQFRG